MLSGGMQGSRGHGETKCSERTGKFPDSKLANVKGKKTDVSSVSPSSERLEELWVVCGFIRCCEICGLKNFKARVSGRSK